MCCGEAVGGIYWRTPFMERECILIEHQMFDAQTRAKAQAH